MISVLREDFVNVWLLAKDLDAIAESSGEADIAQLCKLIQANYAYPVDSVLIASDLRVVGHVNAHEPKAMRSAGYLAFLREGLAIARGEPIPDAAEEVAASGTESAGASNGLKLTAAAPSGSILDLVRRGGFGEPGMSYFTLDATAFASGGELELTVRVGGGKASGKFELCAPLGGDPSMTAPVRTLEKVARGESSTIVYAFDEGARFGLAAMAGAGGVEGDANAFLATVTVRAR